MEQWWNDTDRGTEVLGEKHCIAWMVGEWMSMEQWWNDTDRGNPKYWEGGGTRTSANLSATDLRRTVFGLNTTLRGERPATDRLSHGMSDVAFGGGGVYCCTVQCVEIQLVIYCCTVHCLEIQLVIYCCTVHCVKIQLLILPTICYSDDRMKREEMGEHVAFVGERRSAYWVLGGEAWIRETTWKGGRVLSGLIWLGGVT